MDPRRELAPSFHRIDEAGDEEGSAQGFRHAALRELGLEPRNDDESDACGILDYDLHIAGITPPWRMENVLQQQLGRVA
jgi:hypothetical protein